MSYTVVTAKYMPDSNRFKVESSYGSSFVSAGGMTPTAIQEAFYSQASEHLKKLNASLVIRGFIPCGGPHFNELSYYVAEYVLTNIQDARSNK